MAGGWLGKDNSSEIEHNRSEKFVVQPYMHTEPTILTWKEALDCASLLTCTFTF